MRLHVEVTQDDIDNGCKNDAFGDEGGCMMWRAIKRAVGDDCQDLSVNAWSFQYGRGKKWVVHDYDDPQISRAIRAFDNGEPVTPFSFDFEEGR